MNEEVKHPSRYNQGGIEFWDVEKAFFGLDSHIDHLVQSALEYGVRFRRKNGAEDLRKGANLLNVAADLLEGNTENHEQVEAPVPSSPLQNTITPHLNDLIFLINKFEYEHDGKSPTVVLVNQKFYDQMIGEENSVMIRVSRTDKPNDNTTMVMGVRVVVTESINNHKDIEVL